MNKNSSFLNNQLITTTKSETTWCYGNPYTAGFIWIILHGYGQLAEEFMQHFLFLNPEEHYLIAPNALHHFYLKGGRGKIGASWMTAYNRELDINDNNQYLKRIVDTFILPIKTNYQKVICFGFSQGAPTLIRFLASENHGELTHVILWGAVFPPDVDIKKGIDNLRNKKWYYVIGNKDEYISENDKHQQIHFLETNKFSYQLIEYEGKHELYREVIERIVNIIKDLE